MVYKGRAIPKMDDPAVLLRTLGHDCIEQLEKFLKDEEYELNLIIYRERKQGVLKTWRGDL